ncbi:2-dehydropantoate 2-reductase [Niastella koreensis]|uniref:2-dehydropantoate 2-reductase n=2 Tax=Niastella koreensis TaxID=354356 RepID=G8TFT5_NIAKG|nr:2-dehydropantoate 2-reductase [Niastella koreensis]AEW00534.1 ketopantoate reductase [Niastella koreensis GR20-10]OQP52392.1 2-dehydropantoate 2-reductase [Niastella koreensis]
MPSITIIGPGSVGGTVAAWLARDKTNTIRICARTAFDELIVETPHGTLTVKPEIFTSPEQVEATDWVLIATKTYDVAPTAQWLQRLVAPNTIVAILQNGVEHMERFMPYVPAAQLLPVVVNLPAQRKGPGQIWQTGNGELTVPDTDNGKKFVKLFEKTQLAARTTPDFLSHAWAKLALNSTGAIPALTLQPLNLRKHEDLIEISRLLIRECMAVAKAEGANLDEMLEDKIINGYRDNPSNSINSLHADRLAGRPMETDARNGAIVRIGKKHGIATPMNQLITILLNATNDE